MKKILIPLLMTVILTGCSKNDFEDIKEWMKTEETKLKGRIDKVPPAKTYNPVAYGANIDPFTIKEKVSLSDLLKDKYAPDSKREKEDLEKEALESVRMVGTIIKDGKFFAMIKDKNNIIHYVSNGNYIGINYGQIKKITEGEILLEERIKEYDEWKIKNTKIFLFEGIDRK